MAFLSQVGFAMTATALALSFVGCASRAPLADSANTAGEKVSRGAPERPTDLVADTPSEAIVAIHRSKCGSCHTRVEPGSVPRAAAESAMLRHRRRAKLTERQWGGMVDYLSADGPAHARPTAQMP
jgi:hypothetical protein